MNLNCDNDAWVDAFQLSHSIHHPCEVSHV